MSQHDSFFKEGAEIRRDVLGVELPGGGTPAGDFQQDFREFAVGWCWGAGWGRPQLDRRTRSLITLGMLVAMRSPDEIKLHVKGALRNGVTPEEIREVIMHATIYAGVPAGGSAFHAAMDVLKAEGVFDGEPA